LNLFCHLIAYFAAKNAILLDFQFIRPVADIHLFYISSCDSTQTAIITLIEQGAMGLANRFLPLALYTDDQQNGKGQRGNLWNGETDKNIAMTLAFPILSTQNIDLVLLNKALSVGVLRPLQNVIREKLFLKWPNDIVTESKKLGGLLMEITQVNQQKFLLLGVGINVNQLDWQNQPKAISLARIQGDAFDRDEVMDALLFTLDEIWKKMPNLMVDYANCLWKRGQIVKLSVSSPNHSDATEPELMSGILQDVDQEGRIVILDADGKLLAFHHGLVRLQF
jgi:BirA family biotin operon repressor/biotin-[acetyl-CoA-carboxylase] ligase